MARRLSHHARKHKAKVAKHHERLNGVQHYGGEVKNIRSHRGRKR